MIFHQVLAPLPGGISQQTGVIIQPQQILFTGNKTQVIPTTVAAPTPAQAQIPAAGQQQPQQQQAQPQAPLVLQVDGTGDTSSEEEDDEEEEYDDDEEEEKEKDGGEDGQVEEVNLMLWLCFNSVFCWYFKENCLFQIIVCFSNFENITFTLVLQILYFQY